METRPNPPPTTTSPYFFCGGTGTDLVMDVVSISSDGFIVALLKAELILTANIIAGLAVGELILASGVVEYLFAPVAPKLALWGIHDKIASAMVIAIGAPRSGAAIISGAYSDGEITRREATYGTLSLAFPAYLRRWAGTVAMAVGIAGRTGLIFAFVLVIRSACRFIWVVVMLSKRGVKRVAGHASLKGRESIGARERISRVFLMLKRSLPMAWFFFALTYALVPFADRAFSKYLTNPALYKIIPAEGWAVAISSIAHVTAGLSSAAGAIGTGS
ncbi:MAG: hypothetical protein FWE55_04350, partial [Synergistaceae bacterium]|nr:hypothetical protein [Synergistaceae bacterium]